MQVELGRGRTPETARAVADSPGVRAAVPVDFAHTGGLSATTGSSTKQPGGE